MGKKAIDVVLLPDAEMTERAIAASKGLPVETKGLIELDDRSCLAHISLCMGCIDDADIRAAGDVLRRISLRYGPQQLRAAGISTGTDSDGREVSAFEVENSRSLQFLHEEVMAGMAAYLSYEVSGDMVAGPDGADEPTLVWIRDYARKSSYEGFEPHITLGYGRAERIAGPIDFTCSEIAMCHMGNHCTCRKVLTRAQLGC